ncbi:MAG: glycerol-3-phosphate 1-O-acyltransferase PlsY [Bacteroidota bacterium]
MEVIIIQAVAVVLAYLIGSIPTSVWFGKLFYGIDLRDHGSGNAGATNALRVFGNKAGILVLLIDAIKGWAAIKLSLISIDAFANPEGFVLYQLLLAASVLLGHVFPLFAGFRGGKGIATLAGIAVAMFPWAILISVGVFIIVFLLTRYVSLGSLSGSFAFALSVILILPGALISETVFAIAVALFVPITHKKNIRRLIRGEENRLVFRKKGIAEELKDKQD